MPSCWSGSSPAQTPTRPRRPSPPWSSGTGRWSCGVCRRPARRPARRRGRLPGGLPRPGEEGRLDPQARPPGPLALRGRPADDAEGPGAAGPTTARGPGGCDVGAGTRRRPGPTGPPRGVPRGDRGAARGDRPVAGEVPGSAGALRSGGPDPRGGRPAAPLSRRDGQRPDRAGEGAPAPAADPAWRGPPAGIAATALAARRSRPSHRPSWNRPSDP